MDEFERHDLDLAQDLTDRMIAGLDSPQGPDGKFVKKPEAPEQAAEEDESEPEETVETAESEDDDAAPEETQPSGEDEETEPDEDPPIEPPTFWTKEQKEVWSALTPEARQVVLDRETARDAEVRRTQNEAAEAKKAAQAERETASQERQRYAEQTNQILQYAQFMDPVLAKGPDYWAQLAMKERNGEVEYGTFNAERAEFDQRQSLMAQFSGELKALSEKQEQESRAAYQSRLSEQFPEYVSQKDTYQREWEPVLKEVGFTSDEISQGWGVPHEPRYLKILDLAAKGMKAEAERKAIVQKKAAKPSPKVSKPKAADSAPKVSQRVAALDKRAKETGRDADIANAILARLEEHPT